MKVHPTSSRPRAGLTLIELVIAVTLLGTMLGSVALVSGTSRRAFQRGVVTSALEIRSSAAMGAVVGVLESATLAGLTPDPLPGLNTSQLRFTQATGFSGEVALTAPLAQLGLELEPDEADNGLDDDGDGLVDERQLVLTERVGLATERRRVLTRSVTELLEGELPNGVDDNGNGLVDEQGFVVERRGSALDVQLTLGRATGDGRESAARTARTSIMLRN